MDKAICAITLSTSKPMLVEAVWHKGNLTLLSEQPLPADRKGLLPAYEIRQYPREQGDPVTGREHCPDTTYSRRGCEFMEGGSPS